MLYLQNNSRDINLIIFLVIVDISNCSSNEKINNKIMFTIIPSIYVNSMYTSYILILVSTTFKFRLHEYVYCNSLYISL